MTMMTTEAPRAVARRADAAVPAHELRVGPAAASRRPVRFPAKVELFNGVRMTPTTYAETVDVLIAAAQARQPALAAFAANHILAMAAQEPDFRARMNDFDLVAPDGQPVRWAMNYFHKAGLTDRVYGPNLTKHLCAAAAERGVSIYLYGSTDAVIAKLSENLRAMFPTLVIAGAESPPFRPLTPEEDAAVVKRINDSGAGLLFIGIGAPKQENFAHAHRHSILPVQACVGAAFDFHAGVKSTAPAWMQARGLEWLYRFVKEPRRLWKRYLVTNSVYLALFAKHAALKAVGAWPKSQAGAASSRAVGAGVLAEDDELESKVA
jgi:N-acetylglucosaminyldiphosphoundecaprenol N-acetyl-beta-D-mannosaminyltransferase